MSRCQDRLGGALLINDNGHLNRQGAQSAPSSFPLLCSRYDTACHSPRTINAMIASLLTQYLKRFLPCQCPATRVSPTAQLCGMYRQCRPRILYIHVRMGRKITDCKKQLNMNINKMKRRKDTMWGQDAGCSRTASARIAS
jgi:hypothetical protein